MRVITGAARGRRLLEPQGMAVRPTTDMVKEAMFNIIQFDIEGRRVLDLFAGTGQLGIECLSRGARECVFVDESARSVRLVRANLERCNMSARVEQTDSIAFLSRAGKFDLILLDPPYDSNLLENALEVIRNVDILNDGGIIVCESRKEKILPELAAPYRRALERSYGKVRLTVYKKDNCPGSFDPMTLGHLNIVRRTSRIFERVVVLVMVNANKRSPMFTIDERVDMIKRIVSPFPNVSVETYDGLLAEYAKRYGEAVIVKGLRAGTDFENEFQMAQINKTINPGLETMFLTSSEKYTFLSSSVVRELAGYGADLSDFVPREIIDEVLAKAQGGKKNG